ncbi:chorismate synthase [bacterium SCSIO 12643]|nr:chorismate synthase [bacterium SCSIO 12643]
MSNTFGKIFRLTSFGESHGKAIGGIIDGCPAGLELDLEQIQKELDRRKPGQSKLTTPRKEEDQVEFYSGIFEGKTTGTPIGFVIQNKDQRSKDYSEIKNVYRPSHADFTYDSKYGFRDYRGGGRSSARETAIRVVAGAIAKQILAIKGISIGAYVQRIGPVVMEQDIAFGDIALSENSLVRCPVSTISEKMEAAVQSAIAEKDSLGGVVVAKIVGLPAGLGEPVFDKFHAALGHAMLGINAVKGFEIGSGFAAAEMKGSIHNDAFEVQDKLVRTKTNHSGGVQGGLTNGEEVLCRVAFKPVATIGQVQQTVSNEKDHVEMAAKGRHDPCVVPRAVPIVEAMAALVTVDMLLRNQTSRIDQL